MVEVTQKLNEAKVQANKPRVVRVVPRDERIAASKIMHPTTRARFNKSDASQSVEWPLDKFTIRRIAEGTVTVESTPGASEEVEAYAQRIQTRANERLELERGEQPQSEPPRVEQSKPQQRAQASAQPAPEQTAEQPRQQ